MKKTFKVIASATLALSMFASVAMAETTTVTPVSATTAAPVKTTKDFTDLAGLDATLAVKVDALLAKGYMEGKTDTTFDITGNMTRAEAAKLVAKVLGLTVGTETASSFNDVSSTDGSINWSIPFVEAAKKAGIIDGMTDTTFAPKDKVTLGQLATMFVKGLGKVADVKVTTPWYQGYMDVAKANGVDLGADGSVAATRADLVSGSYAADVAVQASKKLAISSVKQVGAKKIAVTFERAVTADELTKLTTTVKNGFVPYNTTATLSADKLSVVLESTFAFPAGEYTVEVTGFEAQKVTVAAEVASKVEIGALTLQNTTSQNLKVVTTNQFGEEIASAIPDTNISVFDATYAAANPMTVSGGKVDLTNTKVDDTLIVTATHVATGLSATKSFKVVSISSATTMTFGPATPLKDKTKITVGELALAIPYSLKDQYGTALNLPTSGTVLGDTKSFGDITFSTSAPTVVNPNTFAVDADGKLTFTAGAAAGTAIITAVNAKTGAATSFSIKVEDVAKVKTFQLNNPGVLVAASEDVKIPFVAVDSFDKAIATKDFANAATNGQVLLTSSNPAVTFVTAPKYDAITGELVVKFAGTGSTTVYAWINGAIVGQVTLDVKAAAAPVKVTGLKGLQSIEAVNGIVTVDLAHVNVVDTYGRAVTTLPTGYTLTLAKKDSANTTVIVDGSALTVTGAAAGTSTLVIGLANGGTAVSNSTFEYTNTVVADTAIASYSIAAVGETIYGYAANTDADLHAKAVTLIGKDASGNELAIAQGNYISAITSSDTTIATIVNGKIVGLKAGNTTVTAWKGGTKLAEVTVKVSDIAPVVATATFGKVTYAVAAPTVAAPTPTVDLGQVATDFLTVKDQYGVAIAPAAVWTSSDTTKATVNASGVVNGKAAGTVTISYVTSNGVVATTQVIVTP